MIELRELEGHRLLRRKKVGPRRQLRKKLPTEQIEGYTSVPELRNFEGCII